MFNTGLRLTFYTYKICNVIMILWGLIINPSLLLCCLQDNNYSEYIVLSETPLLQCTLIPSECGLSTQ